MSDYTAFLASKVPILKPSGLARIPTLPAFLKSFQRDITAWALRQGRAAIFAGTGLGKTGIQLAWARAVSDHEKRPVLILTPLAVAQQTVAEAEKFAIQGVRYAANKDGSRSDIVVTNYDRVHLFDPADFAGVVLDESSIIKHNDSKTRADLIDRFSDTPWRLCCTATPAPNDYTELGNHAEFLGIMREKEMLAMYFVHDGSIRASGGDTAANGEGWRLKRHARGDFWQWLASWAVVVRDPNEIGYDEPDYALPPLIEQQITVKVPYAPNETTLFPIAARTLSERIGTRRSSLRERVAAAAQLAKRAPGPWLIWCNLNAEGNALENAIPGAIQVTGSEHRDAKTEKLLRFARGEISTLISKPGIAGFGMNFQVCHKMIFVGLNDSFEQLYQAKRRCWRFGQKMPVEVYLIASELEGAVLANLERKESHYEAMLSEMAQPMRDLIVNNLRNRPASRTQLTAHRPMEVPAWL